MTFAQAETSVPDQSIPERFEEMVARYPDRLAVKFAGYSLSYGELSQTSNRIARSLLPTIADPENASVALLFDHGLNVVAAMIGASKAGVQAGALDSRAPEERMKFIVEDARCSTIVTDTKSLALAQRIAGNARSVLNVDDIDLTISHEDLKLPVPPHQRACFAYTSGSTGKPQRVAKTHRETVSRAISVAGFRELSAGERLSLLHSVGFAAGRSDLFSALLNGVAIFPFDVVTEGIHGLVPWLRRERITIFHSSPAVWRELENIEFAPDYFPDLRLIRLTGAPITKRDFELYKKRFAPGTLLEVGMGSTEIDTVCNALVNHDFVFPEEGSPIGYAREGREISIIDDDGQEQSPGEVGEIAVRSREFNAEFCRQRDLPKAKFRRDPKDADTLIYLTGDLGVMLSDGFVTHLGRKDFMVKIRGYRVEVDEIERRLLLHPEIRDAGVVVWDRSPGEKYLAAYVVSRAKPGPKVEELRAFLKDKLPDYMLPSVFMFLESLPLTNGKLDRTALPKPDDRRPDLREPYVPPRSEAQGKLVAIWEEVLGICPIGIHDNFFDLGGHSLAASLLISKVVEEFHLDLQISALVKSPTVEDLGKEIESKRSKDSSRWSYLVALQPGSAHKPVFFLPGGIGGDQEFFVYARLARHVGAEYPFYGLKARSAEGTEPSQASVAQIARDYLGEIRSFQPKGPYSIVGECAGGIIAYEIAQQLREHGQEIALLVLMDTPRPNAALELRRGLSRFLRPLQENYYVMRVGYHREQLRKARGRDKLRYLLTKGSEALAELPQVQHSFVTVDPARELEYIQKSYSQTIYHYRPARYNDKITLFINEETYQSSPDLGWEGLAAGGIEVHKLPGNHTSYIRDNVQIAAKELRRCLENPAKRIRQQNSNTR